MFFPARFLLLLAQSFTEHDRYALGVIAGDEGMYRRYEADFLATACLALGTTHLIKRVKWVRIAYTVSGDGHWQGRLPGW